MIVLGVNLPDRRLVKIALTAFHGVGHSTSRLICARLGLHDRLHVSELTEPQINQLSALLSSPTSFMGEAPSSTPSTSASTSGISATQQQREHDRLANLVIESDLRKVVRDNISHHRAIGTYRGRRFAMQLPVRGQRTKTNAQTARKLNRVDRRNFSTSTSSMAGSTSGIAFQPSGASGSLLTSLKWRFRSLSYRIQ